MAASGDVDDSADHGRRAESGEREEAVQMLVHRRRRLLLLGNARRFRSPRVSVSEYLAGGYNRFLGPAVEVVNQHDIAEFVRRLLREVPLDRINQLTVETHTSSRDWMIRSRKPKRLHAAATTGST